jgi:uncharacterized protein YndB with AHSA1/START domain
MIALATSLLPKDKPQIITSRLLNAPRELVWKLLTSPEHIKHFWGPDGFTNTIQHMDVKPGGQWLYVMHGPDGTDYVNRITYHTVREPSFLGYEHDGGADDKSGHRFKGELELFAEGDKTRIELRVALASIEQRDTIAKYAVAGGIQNLERLAAYVAPIVDAKNTIVVSRSFTVSQERLFKTCTAVEELKQWFAPQGFEIIKAEIDFKPGGTYHYGMRGNGVEMWGKQYYREIKPFSRVVMDHTFSDKDGGLGKHPMSATWPQVTLSIYDFIPEGPNQTRWQITWTYYGINDVEAETFQAAHAGMKQGWEGTFDKLLEYLKN